MVENFRRLYSTRVSATIYRLEFVVARGCCDSGEFVKVGNCREIDDLEGYVQARLLEVEEEEDGDEKKIRNAV